MMDIPPIVICGNAGRATWRSLPRHHTYVFDCDDRYDYWRGVASWWDLSNTLVIVEHDMEVSDALVDELVACPHPRCSHAYQCDLSPTRRVWVHSYEGTGMDGAWVSEGEEWAAYSAIGFCKLTSEVRTRPLGQAPWEGLERSVNDAVRGPWHIHWPGVAHYHLREDQCPDSGIATAP